MNRYLEKIAKEYLVQEHVETSAGNKIGSGVAAAVTAGMVGKKIGPMFQVPVMNALNKWDPTVSNDVLKKIVEDVLPRTNSVTNIREVGGDPVTREYIRNMLDRAGPAYVAHQNMESARKNLHRTHLAFDKTLGAAGRLVGLDKIIDLRKYDNRFASKEPFTKNLVHFGPYKNTDVVVHELGHAVDFNSPKAELKRKISSYGRRSGLPAGLVAGGMLASEKTRDYAWTVPLLAAIPTLREEHAANTNAMKLIKQHGGNARKFIPLAAANMLGYLATPVLTSASVAGMNYLKRKGEEVHPDEWLADR